MLITTERLIIRPHKTEDVYDLYEYLRLPEIYEFEPGEPISFEDAQDCISERMKGAQFLAVVDAENRKMIGHLYFNRVHPEHFRSWELGYIFNPAFHGQGYCTEAAKALVTYAFSDLNAHRVTGYTNPRNIASCRVLEKIGMKHEGTIRKKAYFRCNPDGTPKWHDCKIYGMLESDLN